VVERLRHTPEGEIRRWVTDGPPLWPLGVGYKWPAAGRHRLIVSRYRVQPLLSQQGILERVNRVLAPAQLPFPNGAGIRQPLPALAAAVRGLLQPLLASDSSIAPVFLDVEEPGTLRRSFDLCVHRYQMRIDDVMEPVQDLLNSLLGTGASLERALQGRSSDARITHVSAGWSRHGLPYACIYYEPPDGS